MQASSTSLSPQVARKIALRQGLLFGVFAGCLGLLSILCTRFIPISTFSINFIYVLAFIAFFVSGQRTAKRTHRIDMGALAGFWAGVAVAILGMATLLVLALITYRIGGRISLSSLVSLGFSGLTPAMLALLFGPAIGALGGFIGTIYAETSAPQLPTPPQPTAPVQTPLPTTQPTQPPMPVQPTPPSADQQHQP